MNSFFFSLTNKAAVNRVMPPESQEIHADPVPISNHIPPQFMEEAMDDSSPVIAPYGPPFGPPYDPVYAPPSPPPPPPPESEAASREGSVIVPPLRGLDMSMPDIMPSTSRGNADNFVFKVRFGDIEDTYEVPEINTIGKVSHSGKIAYLDPLMLNI